jgi:hypothetical protein
MAEKGFYIQEMNEMMAKYMCPQRSAESVQGLFRDGAERLSENCSPDEVWITDDVVNPGFYRLEDGRIVEIQAALM